MCVARIVNFVGKTTGKYKMCYDIEYKTPQTFRTKTKLDLNKLNEITDNAPIELSMQTTKSVNDRRSV